ncbi:hypothetical protein Tco_1415073, partial [Tanacetum coccineum]
LVEAEEEPEEHELQNGSLVMFDKCMKKFLNKDKFTKEDLEGPAFRLLKNRFKNFVKLEYNLEQCHLVLIDKIDWANPEGNRFHDGLSKPLSLVGPPGRKTIPTSYFFSQDLEYLKYGNEEKKYALSVTKIKDEHRQWFYKGNIRQKSCHEVYSKIIIISGQSIKVNKKYVKYVYTYLEEIVVKRTDQKEYMFAEADFPYLNQNDIEDLYLLKIQNKIRNTNGVDEFDLINSLQLYIQRILIKNKVEDV